METISSSSGITGSVESLIGGRQENQDSYGMSETRLGMLVAVCDGMGGGPAGKTASTLATQAIIDYVSNASPHQSPLSVLSDAVVAANNAILNAVAHNPTLKGMGTTCVCVLIAPNTAYVVHVGDSRCYQLRGNKVVFRTADHSYVGELVRRGTMSEEEARNSKYSNVITRAIGATPEIDPEVQEVPYKPGDRFALMSDGIWGALPEPNLVKLLSEKYPPAELVPDIAAHVDALGRNNGVGHDNLTLAIVDIPGRRQSVNEAAAARGAKSLNAKFGSASRTSGDDTYQLEEIHDDFDSQKKSINTRRTVLTWCLAIALLVCVAVIIILLVIPDKHPQGEAKNDKSDPQEIVQMVEEARNNDNEQQNSPKVVTQQPQQEAPVIDGQQPDATVKEPEKPKSENITVPNPSGDSKDPANRYLMEALGNLNQLKTYDPNKEGANKDYTKVRANLFNRAVKCIEDGKAKCSDGATKQKLDDLLAYLRTNQRGILTPDSKFHRTTADGEKYLDHCINILQKFSK